MVAICAIGQPVGCFRAPRRRAGAPVVESLAVSAEREETPSREGQRDLLVSYGRVASGLAGAGIFLYVIGVVFWERLAVVRGRNLCDRANLWVAFRVPWRRAGAPGVESLVVSTEPEGTPSQEGLGKGPEGLLVTYGKVASGLAGAGIVLYVIGVVVFWERLASRGFQAQEVIATLPREQIAVAGAREALVSAVAGAIGALVLYGVYRLLGTGEVAGTRGVRAWLAKRMREHVAGTVTGLIFFLSVLIGPVTVTDIVCLPLFLLITFFGVRSIQRSLRIDKFAFKNHVRPWIVVTAGLVAAVFVVSVARQAEFPDQVALATVELDSGTVCGLYLGATSDVIVLGQPQDYLVDFPKSGCGKDTKGAPATTLLVARRQIKRLSLTYPVKPPRAPTSSVLRAIGVPIDCIVPECQIGPKRWGVQELFGRAQGSGPPTPIAK